MIDWMKYRRIYFGISGVAIAIGVFSLLRFGLIPGLDFVGGTIAEYKIPGARVSELKDKVKIPDVEIISISETSKDDFLFRFPPVPTEKKDEVLSAVKEVSGSAEELRFEVVGASYGPELIQKTLYAIGISAGVILLWVAIQFKSFKFGIAAILAMFHDSLVLIGSFSLLGHFFGAEVDFLFVTALLTTLSFSVHDTIVVYDRIRETQKKEGGELYDVANMAVSETMTRSLNNSFTIVFMLFALIILGGESVRWFAVALFIGTISGTYSSPFVAVPLLTVVESIAQKLSAGGVMGGRFARR